jgi:DNA repair protein RecO (recombination protein O)
VLIAGNKVTLSLRARHAEQLASMTVELLESRAPLMAEALAAAAIEWVTALAAATLPEDQPCPDIYEALDGLLAAIAAAPSARRWAGALILFERALMQALGYGGTIPDLAEDWPSVMAGLNANAAALARHLLGDRRRDILAARERLVDRLKRAVA